MECTDLRTRLLSTRVRMRYSRGKSVIDVRLPWVLFNVVRHWSPDVDHVVRSCADFSWLQFQPMRRCHSRDSVSVVLLALKECLVIRFDIAITCSVTGGESQCQRVCKFEMVLMHILYIRHEQYQCHTCALIESMNSVDFFWCITCALVMCRFNEILVH